MTQTYDGGFVARKDKARAGMVTLGRQVKGSQFDTASRLKVFDTDVRARPSLVRKQMVEICELLSPGPSIVHGLSNSSQYSQIK